MQIKDIVNRNVVNITNCDNEPIHIPGSIQPHGFLLGLSSHTQTITYCSGNTLEFTGFSYQNLLGSTFTQVFGNDQYAALQKYISNPQLSLLPPLPVQLNEKQFNCTVHSSQDHFVLEFEPSLLPGIDISDIYLQTRRFTTYMEEVSTLRTLCQAVASETRAITGYDRVMIYKFDDAYNGEVYAESCNKELEQFLGLHYPHTDIPVQARQLYMKNLLRLIVDVNYEPVPIYTIDNGSGQNLDLSLSILRSVSPIHVQYLHNMGVGATLTISLLYQGRLWGLIACHHYSPKYVSMDVRIAAQLQGHFLTSQIPVRQEAEEYAIARRVNSALDELISIIFASETLMLEGLVLNPLMMQLTDATGVAIVVDDEIYSNGAVPGDVELKKLANWLQVASTPTGFNTHRLIDTYADANKCSAAAGVIFHSLGSGANNCIMWFRAEALQEVLWAGDPTKAIEKDEKGLSPRKSFELWKEVKKCESHQWRKPELSAAANFANALQKHVHLLFISKEELKQRTLSEKLQAANAELENMNWIGSHDLKEPLRKIQMFASRILDDGQQSSDNIVHSVKKMSDSASRMQTLIKDILSYSKLSHVEEGLSVVNLNEVVETVLEELNHEIVEKNATIETGDLPNIRGVKFLLQQLFVNLLRNGLKFSRKDMAPVITIQATTADDAPGINNPENFFKVVIKDNGIGFNNDMNELVFKVFTRLHKANEYPGTGVGLALCRKIMQNHNGFITAESAEGKGAAFNLYFPKTQ